MPLQMWFSGDRQLGYADGTTIESFESTDGSRRVDIIKRSDGTARFVEMVLANDEYAGNYWSCSHYSGLYADAATARADLFEVIHWLRRE